MGGDRRVQGGVSGGWVGAGRGGRRKGGIRGGREPPPTLMISGWVGGRRPGRPAEKSKISKNYYCYNNNSRPLGRPIFNIIISTTK